MFVEISEKKFDKLKKILDKMKIPYTVSDATGVWDNAKMLHINITKSLTKNEVYLINEKIDEIHRDAYIEAKGITSELLQKELQEDLEDKEIIREELQREKEEKEQEEERDGLF